MQRRPSSRRGLFVQHPAENNGVEDAPGAIVARTTNPARRERMVTFPGIGLLSSRLQHDKRHGQIQQMASAHGVCACWE